MGGAMRRAVTTDDPATFEVRRILKAFVDAQWLADLDTRLEAYGVQLEEPEQGEGDA